MNRIFNNLKTFYHKLGSSPWFYRISGITVPYVALFSFLFLSIGIVWGVFFSPTDFKQGDVYRIIYMHVPAASVSQSIYYTMTVAAVVSIIWRMKMAGIFIKSMAPIGASFTFLALISGSIWGQPTWGTWWIWDARLTSTLVVCIFYIAIISLYSSFSEKKSADQAVSILTLVGAVNLPIIKKSVDWWNTLHQPASIKFTESSSISPEMLYPLIISIFGFYLVVLLSGLMAMRAEIAKREINKEWFKNY